MSLCLPLWQFPIQSFSGSVHFVERSCPIFSGTKNRPLQEVVLFYHIRRSFVKCFFVIFNIFFSKISTNEKFSLYFVTFGKLSRRIGRIHPVNGICDYPLYLGHKIYRIFLMSRLKIEYLSIASGKSNSAAEFFSITESSLEHDIIGLRDIEPLAVHFFAGNIYHRRNSVRYRV